MYQNTVYIFHFLQHNTHSCILVSSFLRTQVNRYNKLKFAGKIQHVVHVYGSYCSGEFYCELASSFCVCVCVCGWVGGRKHGLYM